MSDGVVGKRPTRGCPQGSILGPIIWDLTFQPCLEMLNELQEVERVAGFAEDLAVVIKGNSRLEIERKSNVVTREMASWCSSNNKLTVSAEKTKFVLFKGKLNLNIAPIIKMNNKTIKKYKLLHISDQHLTKG